MFKLIVLAYAFYGANGVPVVLNDVEWNYQTRGYEYVYFNDKQKCIDQGQAYVDAANESDGPVTKVKFMCVEVKT